MTSSYPITAFFLKYLGRNLFIIKSMIPKLRLRPYSHLDYQKNISPYKRELREMQQKVIFSEPMYVESFQKLMEICSSIAFFNHEHIILFRGQSLDTDKILPRIYRNFSGDSFEIRKSQLEEKSQKLIEVLRVRRKRFHGTYLMEFPFFKWAILQHYECCDTPLLDITQSLHIACSFAQSAALKYDRNSTECFVYALAFPWPQDHFSRKEDMGLIRLLNYCPPKAKRPYFQQAYIASPFISEEDINNSSPKDCDFSPRIVAKFSIPVHCAFWDDNLLPFPQSLLYPKDDLFEKELIKSDILKKIRISL